MRSRGDVRPVRARDGWSASLAQCAEKRVDCHRHSDYPGLASYQGRTSRSRYAGRGRAKTNDFPTLTVRYQETREFAILLPDTPADGAVALAEQIRKRIAQGRFRCADREEAIGGVTISLGVAAYRPDESLEEWLARADRALYASKQHGRNRVTLAASERVAA